MACGFASGLPGLDDDATYFAVGGIEDRNRKLILHIFVCGSFVEISISRR